MSILNRNHKVLNRV